MQRDKKSKIILLFFILLAEMKCVTITMTILDLR